MVQMLGVFAEFERATIIDRVIAGMERKAARGGWTGGPVPYGYRFVPRRLASSDGQAQVLTSDFLEVDPDRSPIVQVIFDLYANKQLGSRAIANGLTERGHRPSGGRPWSFRSVLTILRNRAYVGQVFPAIPRDASRHSLPPVPASGECRCGPDRSSERILTPHMPLGGLRSSGAVGPEALVCGIPAVSFSVVPSSNRTVGSGVSLPNLTPASTIRWYTARIASRPVIGRSAGYASTPCGS
jgi:hypothetical protein